MPPQSNPNVLGFSTGLLQTLATSRSKIDSYVTKKKAEIDKNCALHEETIDKEQKEIDDAHKKLTDVQVQRGVSTTPRNSRTGLAHHKEGLMEELKEVEAKTKEVEVTHAEKEKKIKGEALVSSLYFRQRQPLIFLFV